MGRLSYFQRMATIGGEKSPPVQRGLFDPPVPKPLTAVDIMQAHADIFTKEFLAWLPGNLHIWDAFVREAFKVIARGRTHYSAQTIIEFLRHETALTEAKGEWKINDHVKPYMGRLFDLVHPDHAGLFEFRITKKVLEEKYEE